MYLSAQPNGHLLDVGCGNGWLLKIMQDLGWCVEGVDFDPNAVENARRKGVQVRLGTLEAQQYPDNYFDAITLSHLIEHVHGPLELLRECQRILRPGGRLVLVTPNGHSWGHRIFKDAWLALDPPRHLYVFSVPSLRYLAEKAGFKKFRLSTTIRDANGLFIASKSIQRTGKHVWGSPQPRAFRIWARALQLVEWAILKLKPYIGEEIALMAEK
jgi:SAM-dependent methyltransferase